MISQLQSQIKTNEQTIHNLNEEIVKRDEMIAERQVEQRVVVI